MFVMKTLRYLGIQDIKGTLVGREAWVNAPCKGRGIVCLESVHESE